MCPILRILSLGSVYTLYELHMLVNLAYSIWSKKTITPKENITWIQGNFPRSWSKEDVPFRHCQKICRRVNAGSHTVNTPPGCLFFPKWVAGFPKESVKPRGWKMENFSGGKYSQAFRLQKGTRRRTFPVESENFPDTPMETLVMHPTNTEDARNGAGQSQTCRVLETPTTLCNRNMSFLLLGFWANFPEYFPEKTRDA